jgi:TolB-like protein/DNA-binding winged helix-turn-helix (wHTH) protein
VECIAVVSEPSQIPESIGLGDDFELDLRAYELRRNGRSLKLERIPMDLLVLLVQRRGELVTRDQIIEKIWGKDVFLDTAASINSAIRKIRQVLRDNPEQPRFIQTVTGQGYRFIAPLNAVTVPLDASPANVAPSDVIQRATFSIRWFWAGAVATIFVIAFAVGFAAWRSHERVRQQTPGGRLMMAVLPFDNLTGDSAQEYFSDGFTEEMITQLGRLDTQRIGVIARTSVMHYKNTRQPLARIAEELGVQYVLEGSVRRDAQRVRIATQLIRMQDQTHLWAREYDRQLSDLLSLQSEIAETIAREIQSTLEENRERPAFAQSLPVSPQSYKAYDLYLQGRYHWNKRTPDGFRKALESFQQATEIDSGYARAYAGLADSYAMMSNYGLARASECMPKARAAALKAIQSDDFLAEAHTSLAVVAQDYDHDWQTAEKEYRRAIGLNANYATAHQWYAEYLAFQGRFTEALAESERARELDPLSLIIAADNGAIFYFSRQYDRAIARFRAVLDMDPGFTRAHLVVAAYAQKGQFADALADIDAWRRIAGDRPWIAGWEAYVYGRAGDRAKAQKALQKVEQLSRKWQVDPAQFMIVSYAGMGDKEKCLAWLEKAISEHTNMTGLKVDPLYDPLRSDPRFQDLLRRVGFAQ